MPAPANDDAATPLVSERQLRAYVEGALPSWRRVEVEGYLACNPDLAADVMAARHFHGRRGMSGPLRWLAPLRRRWAILALAACLASGAGIGFAADEMFEAAPVGADGLPVYVAEAVMAHRTSLVRADMTSQPETSRLDPDEIRRAMRLRLPPLPRAWRVLDVQVYPSDDGPSLGLLIDVGGGRRMTLFAVHADTGAPDRPRLARRDGQYVAYWDVGDSAYALIGSDSGAELVREAVSLSRGML